MCQICEKQFGLMTGEWDEIFGDYRKDWEADHVRQTPAERVHDVAHAFTAKHFSDPFFGVRLSWWLAIMMERHMALEQAGVVPTPPKMDGDG